MSSSDDGNGAGHPVQASRRLVLGAGIVGGTAGILGATTRSAAADVSSMPGRHQPRPSETELPLDVTRLEPRFVTRLHPGGNPAQVVQGACKDTLTGDYYLTQNIAAKGQTYRSLRITHCSPAGRYLDEMVCVAAGHGDTLSITRDPQGGLWCWFTWEENDATGKTIYDFVRVPYAAGADVHRDDSPVKAVPKFDEPSGTKALFAIDQVGDRMAVRKDWGSDYSSPSTYVLRRLSDVLAGTNKILATVKTKGGRPPSGPGTAQSFCTADNYLYVNYGSATLDSGKFSVQRYTWSTGANDGSVDTSMLGSEVDGAFPSDSHEAEGISTYRDANGNPGLVVCMGFGAVRLRQAKLYAIAPLEVDVAGGAPLENVITSTQAGTVSITPTAANSDTSVVLAFPYGMPGTPVVQVTPQAKCQTWITDIGATGCTVWVNAADTTPITLGWTATSPA